MHSAKKTLVAAGICLLGCSPLLAVTLPAAETSVPASAPVLSGWPGAREMLARMRRGMNFANALDAPAEGDWGVVLQEEYFQLAKDAGFSTIRLPVRWNTHALESEPYTIEPAFFDRVDWAVKNALTRGMILILDFHHFTDFMDCAGCERGRLLALWSQIAEHYRDYPPELLFELLNEPTDAVPAAEWNEALAEALAVVRISNPQRIVVVGPVDWNGLPALPSLVLPEEDRRLIATFHYYEPFDFTHQGADWVEGSDAWLGTDWTGNETERRAVHDDLSSAAAWGRAHDRPVFLGEFGSHEEADMDSRARYTAYVAREAEALSLAWAYWQFASDFGVYDAAARRWKEPLLRALIPDSPELAE